MARRKAAGQRRHAKRRAAERHGIVLNKFDIKQAVLQIQNGSALFLERQSLRVTKWSVALGGKRVSVVYDRKSHTLATVLPENSREELQGQGSLSALPSQEMK